MRWNKAKNRKGEEKKVRSGTGKAVLRPSTGGQTFGKGGGGGRLFPYNDDEGGGGLKGETTGGGR